MAAKSKLQFNQSGVAGVDNYGRGSASSFVVDLRTTVKKIEEEVETESRVVKQSLTRQAARLVQKMAAANRHLEKKANRLKKQARSIKPNLLPQSILPNFSFKLWPVKRVERTASKSRTRVSFWKDLFNFSPRRNNWQGFVRQQIKILNRSPRLDKINQLMKSAGANRQAVKQAQERADLAEDKAVWYKSILSFIIILLLLIIPIKLLSSFELLDLRGLEDKVMNSSQLALNNLMAAADSVSSLDFKTADGNFQAASVNFLAAQEDLSQINDGLLLLASLSSDPKMKLAAESKKFITAGAVASSLGSNLVLATDSLFNGDQSNFSARLDNFLNYGQAAVSDAKTLKKDLARINPANLPSAYQSKFVALTKQVSLLADSLADFVAAGEKFKEVLGLSHDKRYLLVFQNNAELRASGGFIGSYALVDIRDGKIRNLEVPGGGSYDTEAGMKNWRVIAPAPLWLVNPLWHFWDANWWPDWPTTAKNLMWFYEKSDGPSVDGVIGLTPTVVEGLLEITGPIDLTAEYGLIIDANNFWTTVQTVTEQKNLAKTNPEAVSGLRATSAPITASLPLKQDLINNADNKPKKIIGDLMAKILEVLPTKLTKDNLLKIITLFEKNMAEKQIMLYFTDPALQAEMVSWNFAGEIKNTERDYLMVVNTNIAGQKSDRLMTETISQTSVVDASGTIINTLEITRTHTGRKNEPLTGVRNVDWLRVYVPSGSELISASGFTAPDAKYFNETPDSSWTTSPLLANEDQATSDPLTNTKIYLEKDKTVFANWVMVDPGETATITIKYRLPFNLLIEPLDNSWLARINRSLNPAEADLLPYSLLVQKQPGAKPSNFSSRLLLPPTYQIFWRYPEDLSGLSGWDIQTSLDADQYWSVLVKQELK